MAANGTLTADGFTDVIELVTGNVHVSINDDFNGGTFTLEKRIAGTWFPLYDAGAAYSRTAPDDDYFFLGAADAIRGELSGSTSPNLVWSIGQKSV